MVKPFPTYQYLEGEPMSERDKLELNSKFWNKGKWDNFVAPFIKPQDDPRELSLVDMGCNSGLFLKLAQEAGFGQIIGVDSDVPAVERGIRWRDATGGNYKFVNKKMEDVIDDLPVVDYTVFANAHYYITINDWLDYLDKLQYKTRYIIIVTAEKRHGNRCWAQADIPSIRRYFKTWEEVGFIDVIPDDGEPGYRKLWSLCFKSPFIERVDNSTLDRGNHVQDGFYKELDEGKKYQDTRYYHIIEKYRRGKWSPERLARWFEDRVKLYNDVKENGLKKPILIDGKGLVLDGNHRDSMLESLGYKTVLVRKT